MKRKKIDKITIITTLICLLPMLLTLVLYDKLPAEVPIHFDISGTPDNYASKAFAGYGIPLLMALGNLLVNFFLLADPKADNSTALRNVARWVVPVITFILMPITLLIALGVNLRVEIIVPVIVGIVLVIIGNYLPKCKPNYTVGIRLPWTLNSAENWAKTHHIAGWLWIVGGLIMIACGFFTLYFWAVIIAVMLLLIVVPMVYSYILYKKGV